ncbi:copper homeostasis protein [Brachyspira alvinipulli]|uniref:copper homeostasis protein n=1 Tax=Brachyspira alvinipulli TaxID=84379 RepID=UPI0004864414|nr:copper homeostasis protein [Brachyspira alvinipulli]
MKRLYSLLIIFIICISCSVEKNHETQNIPDPILKVFEGDFIYLVDSAVFTDYATSSNFQIAMEREYFNLEREFISFNFEEPTKIYLQVEGYLEDRPGIEKDKIDTFLIVTKIIGFDTNRITSLL